MGDDAWTGASAAVDETAEDFLDFFTGRSRLTKRVARAKANGKCARAAFHVRPDQSADTCSARNSFRNARSSAS
jgi:hypothetical protein